MTKILVTGGAGFIGSHIVRDMVKAGVQVVVLDDLSTGKRENIPQGPQVDFRVGDVGDKAAVRGAMEGCTHVVHLAALASVPLSIEQPEKTFASNVGGFENVLEVARELKMKGWVLYASSAAVYGPLDKTKAVEADALGAALQSPYAVSKAMNELQGRLYRDVLGVPTVGLRFFNVYGPGQDASNPYSGVLGKVVNSVKTGELLTIYGDGGQTRDFVTVGDVVQVVRGLLNRPVSAATPPVMNLGCGVAVSLLDTIRQVVALTKVNPRVEYRPSRGGDIRHSCADVTALREVLPEWKPLTLQEGLRAWLL